MWPRGGLTTGTVLHKNRLVFPRLGRLVCALAAIVGLAGLTILPPEHVHGHGDVDHHAATVHRHFAPHHHDDETTARAGQHPRVQAPDDDGRTVQVVFVGSPRPSGPQPPLFAIAITSDWDATPRSASAVIGAFTPAPHPSPPAAPASPRAPPQP